MDFFTIDKLNYLASSNPIQGIKSVLWVERYNRPGEFKIKGDPLILMSQLPLGIFITHSKTFCVMEVEDHFIDETEDGPPQVVITGRDILACVMDNRVVSISEDDSDTWDFDISIADDKFSGLPMTFSLSGNSWDQVKNLLDRYLGNNTSGVEEIPNLDILIDSNISPTDLENDRYARDVANLKRLSNVVYKCLRRSDLGLKIIRPNFDLGTNLTIYIHLGLDLSDTVVFDNLSKARYFWSDKKKKNGFLVGGIGHYWDWATTDHKYPALDRAYTVRNYEYAGSGWDAKIVGLYDEDFNPSLFGMDYEDPVTYDHIDLYSYLNNCGRDLLKDHRSAKYIEAPVNKNSPYVYGIHYNIGDKVQVNGSYEVGSSMRLIEHALTVDGDKEDFVQIFSPAYHSGYEPGPT